MKRLLAEFTATDWIMLWVLGMTLFMGYYLMAPSHIEVINQ